jgi:uncharacterized membrane protein
LESPGAGHRVDAFVVIIISIHHGDRGVVTAITGRTRTMELGVGRFVTGLRTGLHPILFDISPGLCRVRRSCLGQFPGLILMDTNTSPNKEPMVEDDKLDFLITITNLVYALQTAVFLAGIPYLVAIVINYVKRDDVQGTWLESHFRWQIRTFWFSLLWFALGAVTYVIVIGYFILVADAVWVIYRIVKGWLALYERKPLDRGSRA